MVAGGWGRQGGRPSWPGRGGPGGWGGRPSWRGWGGCRTRGGAGAAAAGAPEQKRPSWPRGRFVCALAGHCRGLRDAGPRLGVASGRATFAARGPALARQGAPPTDLRRPDSRAHTSVCKGSRAPRTWSSCRATPSLCLRDGNPGVARPRPPPPLCSAAAAPRPARRGEGSGSGGSVCWPRDRRWPSAGEHARTASSGAISRGRGPGRVTAQAPAGSARACGVGRGGAGGAPAQ